MKQLDRSAEAIKAINCFCHLCSHEPQESLTNIMLQFYKVWTNRESDIIASIKIAVMGMHGLESCKNHVTSFSLFLSRKRGEYSQWVERFMNYLEEQMDGEAMIISIKNSDQPLPRVTQVSIAGTSSTEQPPLKDKSMWSSKEKKIQKIDRLTRSLLIQGLPNDIYSLIDSNKTAKDLWDALARHMLGSEYGEQDRKAAILYEYETFSYQRRIVA
nr:hypothetical protein [Tanacetum cinerariifolium]